MDLPVPASVLSELGELRRVLQGELRGLVEKRGGLEGELQMLGKEIESKQRALELVEATERQLASQGRGEPELEGQAQVRGRDKRVHDINESVWSNLALVSIL
jgi:hypothetical protein